MVSVCYMISYFATEVQGVANTLHCADAQFLKHIRWFVRLRNNELYRIMYTLRI